MIQFPETAQTEWQIVADAANAEEELKARLEHDSQVQYQLDKMRVRHDATQIFQQEIDAETTPTLEMFTLANYQSGSVAGPGDLIEGVLKDNGVCIVLGPGGSGKSTLGLQMLHSLMTGDEWLGQPVQKVMGSVGIVSYDMDGRLMMDWVAGFPNVDPNKVQVVNAHKRGNPLGVPALRAQIAAAWKASQTEIVVIDSFSASFFAQDQNDAAATQHHYRDLGRFALTEVGARAVIVIVHSTDGSPKKPRGSTVHHDVGDSIVAVWSPTGPLGSRHVEMTKYRQHRDVVGNFTSMMTPVVVSAPDSVTHLVSLDLGAMQLAGMHLPASAGAAAFTDLPDTNEDPDIDSEEDGEDDDL